MGRLKQLKKLFGLHTTPRAKGERPSCIACGRPVANRGDICASCDAEEIDRLGH